MRLRWVEIEDQDDIQSVPTARRFEWDGDHYYKLQAEDARGVWSDVEIETLP